MEYVGECNVLFAFYKYLGKSMPCPFPNRKVEGELFPCLRNFGIAFYAYNPVSGNLVY